MFQDHIAAVNQFIVALEAIYAQYPVSDETNYEVAANYLIILVSSFEDYLTEFRDLPFRIDDALATLHHPDLHGARQIYSFYAQQARFAARLSGSYGNFCLAG